MGEPTMEEYMTKTREDYGSGIAWPKIDEKAHFELKEQFLKELHDNAFSGSDNEDANEHIEKVLEIVDLFETYVKSKDLDLWHVITDGDFPPIQNNPETKKDEVVPFHKQNDDLKKKLAKNNEAKMVIYNALPRKEYERIFMCQTAKEIWDTLLITHQGNNQVKANKIDLLVQQYEQFTIPEEESIDNAFAKFNTIITSLKALDEGCSIVSIRTDHGREFDNEVQFRNYCDLNGISHNFSAPTTTTIKMGSIKEKSHSTGKTPYELLRGRKPNLNYFRVFESKCFVLNTKDYLTKFDPKSYEGVFLGYSQNSKAYIILNKQTMKVEESLNVTFDETPPPPKTSPLEDDELVEEEAIEVSKTKPIGNNLEDISLENNQIVNIKESKTHPLENVIGNLKQMMFGN
ncbi:DUF4219 domain-containing protein [Tanacetum coccineum]